MTEMKQKFTISAIPFVLLKPWVLEQNPLMGRNFCSEPISPNEC